MKQNRNASYLNQNSTKLNYVIKFSLIKCSLFITLLAQGFLSLLLIFSWRLLLVWISCVGQEQNQLLNWSKVGFPFSVTDSVLLYRRRSSGLPTLVPAANRYGVVIRLAQERYLPRTGPAASPPTFVAAVGSASTLSFLYLVQNCSARNWTRLHRRRAQISVRMNWPGGGPAGRIVIVSNIAGDRGCESSMRGHRGFLLEVQSHAEKFSSRVANPT